MVGTSFFVDIAESASLWEHHCRAVWADKVPTDPSPPGAKPELAMPAVLTPKLKPRHPGEVGPPHAGASPVGAIRARAAGLGG